jgi:uncharacterized protein (DUF1015 family)
LPEIYPFTAIFPASGLEPEVAVNSHLPLSEEKLRVHLQNNPFSYYHIFKPQLHFKENDSSGKFFTFGKKYFQQLIEQGVLIEEKQPAYYVYKQQMASGSTFSGVISTLSVEDYENGKIKKHEHTIKAKEEILQKHLEVTGLIGEPVLLTYPDYHGIDALLEKIMNTIPSFKSFQFDDDSIHIFWKITEGKYFEKLKSGFEQTDSFYIADGHHRCAGINRFINHSGIHKNNLLSYLVSDKQLKLFSFYRLVKDSGLKTEELLEHLKKTFQIRQVDDNVIPVDEYEIVLATMNQNYLLSPYQLPPRTNGNTISGLNVSFFESQILRDIFKITDSTKDERVDFIPGKIPIQAIKSLIKKEHFEYAFILPPLRAEQIFEVSDKNLVMPPKSTYVEPKLLSGAVILAF